MTIRTKLHILAENVATEGILADGENAAKVKLSGYTFGRQDPLVKRMLAAADYVMDTDVVDLLRREDVSDSINALCEAGIARLPVSPMVVEFEINPKYHEFVFLEEKDGQINCYYATLFKSTNVAMLAREPVLARISQAGVAISSDVPGTRKMLQRVLEGGSLHAIEPKNNMERFDQLSLSACALAVKLALLMLNTKGIEKDIIDVPALNRSRAGKGKPAIPRHTVVHIGRIYRRDGTSIKSDGTRGGWSMPMHIRQAHTRTQRFGPGLEQTKTVFIPMVIVNYEEGKDIPQPKKIIRI